MDLEEEAAKKRKAYVIGQDLYEMSVDELAETLQTLKDEIARVEKTKAQKSDHLSAAEALFATKT